MKKIVLLFINLYKNFFSYTLKSIVGVNSCCRFSPTCSEYARISVKEKGVLKGSQLSLIRLLKCQPFYKII
jgi:putative membrane protein insertion efficiency factor